MTEAEKTTLEEKNICVDSEKIQGLIYAIDRKGKGIALLSGKSTMFIPADKVNAVSKEMADVWNHIRRKTVLGR